MSRYGQDGLCVHNGSQNDAMLRENIRMKERLDELEVRAAFQEQTIQELNDVITRQQQEIDRLVKDMEMVKSRLKGLAPSLVIPQEEEKPPPHY